MISGLLFLVPLLPIVQNEHLLSTFCVGCSMLST